MEVKSCIVWRQSGDGSFNPGFLINICRCIARRSSDFFGRSVFQYNAQAGMYSLPSLRQAGGDIPDPTLAVWAWKFESTQTKDDSTVCRWKGGCSLSISKNSRAFPTF